MLTIEEIDALYFKSDDVIPDGNFVAAAVQVNENGEAAHAGIIISCDEGYFLCHYSPGVLEETHVPTGQWYFHKVLNVIEPEMAGHFLGHCRTAASNSIPQYGCFYPGSYYVNGQYFNAQGEQGPPEFMTCVGFCLTLIKGWLAGDEYLSFTDWNEDSLSSESYRELTIERIQRVHPELTEEMIRQDLRRITPIEYLASAYISALPVRKISTDEYIERLETIVSSRRLPAAQA